MNGMDPQQKVNCKRCIQAILPSVPGPVVDYALSTPFLSSIIAAPAPGSSSAEALDGNNPFTFRKMNSGNFGELSIISPKGGKHLKIAEAFADGAKMHFSMNNKPRA